MNGTAAEGTVIITGAAGGMGRPAAQRFAAQGKPLLLCDINADRLQELSGELESQAASVQILAGDIAAPDFPDAILKKLAGAPIAALVHTAGLSPTMADAERIFTVNYDASEALVRTLLPHFAKDGAAVLISSVSAYMLNAPEMLGAIRQFVRDGDRASIAPFMTDPGMGYAISKRAVIGLVEREAPAFGARGCRICSIAPGFIDTAMGRAEAETSDQMRAMITMVPQQRLGHGDEIAAVAQFLCSPGASYVSGCDIRVDGGIIGRLGQ